MAEQAFAIRGGISVRWSKDDGLESEESLLGALLLSSPALAGLAAASLAVPVLPDHVLGLVGSGRLSGLG